MWIFMLFEYSNRVGPADGAFLGLLGVGEWVQYWSWSFGWSEDEVKDIVWLMTGRIPPCVMSKVWSQYRNFFHASITSFYEERCPKLAVFSSYRIMAEAVASGNNTLIPKQRPFPTLTQWWRWLTMYYGNTFFAIVYFSQVDAAWKSVISFPTCIGGGRVAWFPRRKGLNHNKEFEVGQVSEGNFDSKVDLKLNFFSHSIFKNKKSKLQLII